MRARRPCRVRARWRSRPRRSLSVQKIDSMRWRIRESAGPRAGSSLRAGRRIVAPKRCGVGVELAAGVALVADDQLAAVQAKREQSQRDVAFLLVGGGEDRGARRAVGGGEQMQSHAPKPAGVAAAVVMRAGRRQLRAAGGLDRAAALDRGGVEQHDLVEVAGAVLRRTPPSATRSSRPAAPALPVAGLRGQPGEQVPKRARATARNSRSDAMSMIAWATASVTTSASVTLRLAFFGLSGRRSSAVANTAISSRSRSASIVALLGRRCD